MKDKAQFKFIGCTVGSALLLFWGWVALWGVLRLGQQGPNPDLGVESVRLIAMGWLLVMCGICNLAVPFVWSTESKRVAAAKMTTPLPRSTMN